MLEILRMSSIAPISLPHRTVENVVFHGYQIPKNTIIIPDLYGIHYDEAIWNDPKNFRPERFLNEDGTVNRRQDVLMPFSIGRRSCIGDGLAQDQLFLFLTAIIQKYFIKPNPTKRKPNPNEFKFCQVIRQSKSYEYILRERGAIKTADEK